MKEEHLSVLEGSFACDEIDLYLKQVEWICRKLRNQNDFKEKAFPQVESLEINNVKVLDEFYSCFKLVCRTEGYCIEIYPCVDYFSDEDGEVVTKRYLNQIRIFWTDKGKFYANYVVDIYAIHGILREYYYRDNDWAKGVTRNRIKELDISLVKK